MQRLIELAWARQWPSSGTSGHPSTLHDQVADVRQLHAKYVRTLQISTRTGQGIRDQYACPNTQPLTGRVAYQGSVYSGGLAMAVCPDLAGLSSHGGHEDRLVGLDVAELPAGPFERLGCAGVPVLWQARILEQVAPERLVSQ